jgi:hypothetical protein
LVWVKYFEKKQRMLTIKIPCIVFSKEQNKKIPHVVYQAACCVLLLQKV